MSVTPVTPLHLNSFRTGPDEKGHFGLYGGRFVAETLMPLILELEAAYNQAQETTPPFMPSCETSTLCRPAESALVRRAADPASWRREDLFQTRRTQPHWFAQDQQLPWPDPAGTPHGQDAASSPRPAPGSMVSPWPRCAALFGLPCIVYMGQTDIERQSPNVFRMQPARRRGAPRDLRHGDAEGRHERGLARLGRQCRGHLLHHRHGRRARIPIRPWCAISSRSSARRRANR